MIETEAELRHLEAIEHRPTAPSVDAALGTIAVMHGSEIGTEQQPLPDISDTKILDSASLPERPLPEGTEPVTLRVTSDQTVLAGDQNIKLRAYETFILNALILSGDRSLSGADLRRLGFAPDLRPDSYSPTLSRALNNIGFILEKTANTPLLIKSTEERYPRYRLDARLKLVHDYDQTLAQQAKQIPVPKAPPARTEADNAEKPKKPTEAQKRQADIITAIKPYRNHPEVLKRLDQVRRGDGRLPSPHADAVGYSKWITEQYSLITDPDTVPKLAHMIRGGLEAHHAARNEGSASPEHEAALIDMAYAFQHLYLANVRLVLNIAKRYTSTLPLEELIQFGNEGLATAVCRYDADTGNTFSTYATTWIEHAIRAGIAETARTIRIPEKHHNVWLKVKRAQRELINTLDRMPTSDEIGAECNMDAQEVDNMMREGALSLPSLNMEVSGNDGGKADTLGDVIPSPLDEVGTAIEALSDRSELTQVLKQAELNTDEKLLLGLRFGLALNSFERLMANTEAAQDSREIYRATLDTVQSTHPDIEIQDGLTLEQIGKLLGVTRQSIGVREQKVIKRLQTIAQARAA